MHVLIISTEDFFADNNELNGIFQLHQAKALQKRGVKVNIISPSVLTLKSIFKIQDYTYKIKKIKIDGIFIFKYQSINFIISSEFHYLKAWLKAGSVLFKEYVKSYGIPDIIHAHNHLFAGVLSKKIFDSYKIPYIVTEHSSEYVKGVPKSEFMHEQVAKSYNLARRNLFVSEFLGKNFMDSMKFIPKNNSIMYNCLSANFEEKKTLFKISNYANFIFLNVASLLEVKNHSFLIQGFAKIFKNSKNVKLNIVGDGPLFGSLSKLVSELGIEDQIFFLGRLSNKDVAKEMLKADVFILTSHKETFGVVVIEALSHGIPVISSNCGGPEELIENWVNGVIYDKKDEFDFQKKILKVFNEYEKFDKKRISEQVLNSHSSEKIATQLVDIYNAEITF